MSLDQNMLDVAPQAAKGDSFELVNFRKKAPFYSGINRFTHLMHSYPAKLLVNIPYYYLNDPAFCMPGMLVADPFCGSGTVLIEAMHRGCDVIGSDTNPLARLISRAKTRFINGEVLTDCLARIIANAQNAVEPPMPIFHNRDKWFDFRIQGLVARLLNAIKYEDETSIREFFYVCLSSVIGKLSNADPHLSVPVMLRPNKYAEYDNRRKVAQNRLENLKTIDVFNVFRDACNVHIKRLQTLYPIRNHATIQNDARILAPTDPRRKIDLIITSPPYAGAQKYIRASSLSIGWLSLAEDGQLRTLEKQTIGREHYEKSEYSCVPKTGIPDADALIGDIYKENPLRAHILGNYLMEMRECFIRFTDVLRSGGKLIIVMGDNVVAGRPVPTHRFLCTIAVECGLEQLFTLRDDIRSRGLMTKRNRTASIIPYEWIVGFERP